MSKTIDTYDELYSISDLHIGGVAGQQLFDQRASDAMSWLCDHIVAKAATQDVGLVINGDVFDFLAEDNAVYCEGSAIVTKLDAIARRPEYAQVLAAWQRVLSHPRARLVFVIGNHDIELALPWAQKWLHDHLIKDNGARFILAADGTGYDAIVGGRRVYFVHGNEADEWNWVDHEGLRRVNAAVKRRGPLPGVQTNQGTRLVVDLMNKVKVRYPFVDQLKPERGPVVSLLLALDDRNLQFLPSLAGNLFSAAIDGVKQRLGLLSTDDEAGQFDMTVAESIELVKVRTGYVHANDSQTGEAVLWRTEEHFQSGKSVRRNTGADGELLGGETTLGDTFRPLLKPALRLFLRQTPQTFDLLGADDIGDRLMSTVGFDVDFLVAGHTHLRRAKPRGQGVYFNSGTWAKLMRIDAAAVDTKGFEEFVSAIENEHVPDRQNKLTQFTRFEPTVVVIRREDDKVVGYLATVLESAPHFDLVTLPGSAHKVDARGPQ